MFNKFLQFSSRIFLNNLLLVIYRGYGPFGKEFVYDLGGRLRLHANVARFQRPLLKTATTKNHTNDVKNSFVRESSKVNDISVYYNSYAGVVKLKEVNHGVEIDNKPSLVLDDSCILQRDYSLSLMGKVLDFGSLSSMKMILAKEGFNKLTLKYMGGFWILIEFCSKSVLDKLKSHVGVGSWFSVLQYASNSFMINERVAWLDIKVKEVSGWVPDFMKEEESDIESDEEIDEAISEQQNSDMDRFDKPEGDTDNEVVYEMIFEEEHKHGPNDATKVSDDTLKYPSGFTPVVDDDIKSDEVDKSVRGKMCAIRRILKRRVVLRMDGCVINIEDIIEIQVSEKKRLWDYFLHLFENWNGEIIIMGDFNEVCSKDERYGSLFNVHNAVVFNSFISLGGLVEVPLGCYHRHILLREDWFDYGPVLFRLFHYWFEWEGFDKFVTETWSQIIIVNPNAISNFMKKLKCLKEKIRVWTKAKKESEFCQKSKLKGMLSDIDSLIDNCSIDHKLINKRSDVMKSLQDLEKLESLEVAQKAKIKWSIKGDENTKYFHGILNKKRNQLAIRGILVVDNAMYSASAEDIAVAVLFTLYIQLTVYHLREPYPSRSAFPRYHGCPAGLGSENAVSSKPESFGYQSPMLMVPFRYLKDSFNLLERCF
ncbi:hypothetical protein Tco_1313330 [Tanacetum coccineum]